MRKLIEELPGQQTFIIILLENHRSQTKHILLEVVEVGFRLILWVNISDVHPEAVGGFIVVIRIQLQICFDEFDGHFR